ncbi:MAG: porphobilinogen synthase [Parachlamydiaceae bacterium]
MHSMIDSPTTSLHLPIRLRRKRQHPGIRALLQETHLNVSDLVAPLFMVEGTQEKQMIPSMPDVFRFSLDLLIQEIRELHQLGITTINLFSYVPHEKKDPLGSEAIRSGNLLHQAIDAIKNTIPDILLTVDIALDPYTSHGHDGVLDEVDEVDNDRSCEQLGKMALLAAEAGVDMIAPSDMMDGRIGYLRTLLDQEGYSHVGIISYAVKFASAFYGPFRSALDSAPRFGDKKGYYVNPANSREALLECALDEAEGADMLIIKPGLPYLDVITKVKERTLLPIGAYHVSGEYSMIMAAAQNGWIDKDKILAETLLSIKRAGADFIFTYGAKHMAQLLNGM